MQKLMTLKDAATLLSVSPEFLKKLQRQNRLHVIRIGSAVRISEAEIDRLCHDEFRNMTPTSVRATLLRSPAAGSRRT